MSVQNINVLVSPAHRLAPGAAWLVDAAATLAGRAAVGAAAWRARAAEQRRIRRLVREQSELQALALRYLPTQPSFAKELLQAAMKDREA